MSGKLLCGGALAVAGHELAFRRWCYDHSHEQASTWFQSYLSLRKPKMYRLMADLQPELFENSWDLPHLFSSTDPSESPKAAKCLLEESDSQTRCELFSYSGWSHYLMTQRDITYSEALLPSVIHELSLASQLHPCWWGAFLSSRGASQEKLHTGHDQAGNYLISWRVLSKEGYLCLPEGMSKDRHSVQRVVPQVCDFRDPQSGWISYSWTDLSHWLNNPHWPKEGFLIQQVLSPLPETAYWTQEDDPSQNHLQSCSLVPTGTLLRVEKKEDQVVLTRVEQVRNLSSQLRADLSDPDNTVEFRETVLKVPDSGWELTLQEEMYSHDFLFMKSKELSKKS